MQTTILRFAILRAGDASTMRYRTALIAAIVALTGCSGRPAGPGTSRLVSTLAWMASFRSSNAASSIAFPALNESATLHFVESCTGGPDYHCPDLLVSPPFVLAAPNTCTSFSVDAGKPMQPAASHTVTALSPGSCVLTAAPSDTRFNATALTVNAP